MEQLVERWAKLPSRQRYAIIGVVAVAILAGYWYFFYSDLAGKLEQMAAGLRDTRPAVADTPPAEVGSAS